MGLFSKKERLDINSDQNELIEHAQDRVRQKKRLYYHFVLFLAGAILIIVINLVLGIGKDYTFLEKDWFIWAILLWCFFFLAHLINVFFLSVFMNKKWERIQIEKLVQKQQEKIAKFQDKIDTEMPLPRNKQHFPNHK